MKYVGYYDSDPDRRISSPAAVDKMNYIAEVASRFCEHVDILSCSTCSPTPDKGHVDRLNESISVKYIKTRNQHKTKAGKIYDVLYDRISIFLFLMKNIRFGETVIVYHSLLNMSIIRLVKRIKKIKLILEVEEIYNDVGGLKKDTREKELDYISVGDAYIFPTRIMNQQFNISCKEFAIVHGTYDVNNNTKPCYTDGKTHVVYAGTFDQKKGGALTAIESAKYLSDDFVLHILGFGTEIEVENVRKGIEKIGYESDCRIIYEGKLTGKEYVEYISKCDIGLSSQNPDGEYNNTSFPSKILSYMCNGLKVVSVRIPVVEDSGVSDGIVYYDSGNPKVLAEAIQKARVFEVDSKMIVKDLDKKFENDLKSLIVKGI